MSRNAAPSPAAGRMGPPSASTASHKRQTSKTSFDRASFDSILSPDSESSNSTVRDAKNPKKMADRICAITITDDLATRDKVLLNLDLFGGAIEPGALLSIVPVKPDQDKTQLSQHASSRSFSQLRGLAKAEDLSKSVELGRKYTFVAKDMSKEMKAKHPKAEVYVGKHIGDAFGMRKGTQVLLSPVDPSTSDIYASHVELSFKDMYLSRADMWRFAVSELADRTVFQGQTVWFLGTTIKATVTTVFLDGRKVDSAFFGPETRPIFRSESARYVLFIQMAREMWDFDSDGSGEIVFSKVVNGFLPALFKRWAMLQVKHLVSIVLFARVEYDAGLSTDLESAAVQNDYYTGYQTHRGNRPYKDFYHVVVSEMSSGEWTTILHQLKREFNNFRRDINLHHQTAMRDAAKFPSDSDAKLDPINRIKAESSLAMFGNFLEAINLASTQYAHDYIDRDLLRTGISVIVITPGTGVFEVEYESLRRTTEALVGNGIGIDLICMPKVPLHSVPLFRYRNPHSTETNNHSKSRSLRSHESTPKQSTPLAGSYTTSTGSFSPSKVGDGSFRADFTRTRLSTDEWCYAMPQWLHVSYWTGRSEGALSLHGITLVASENLTSQASKSFAVRCRLYDLQMRSILETNEIETTPLHSDPNYPDPNASRDKKQTAQGYDSGRVKGSANKVSDVLFDQVSGFHKFAPDKAGRGGDDSIWKQLRSFDESRAKLPKSRIQKRELRHSHELDDSARKQLLEDAGLFGTSVPDKKALSGSLQLGSSLASTSTIRTATDSNRTKTELRRSSVVSNAQTQASTAKVPKFMRQISLGQRGFGVAAPKAAVAELSTEHVNAKPNRDTSKTPKLSGSGLATPIKANQRPLSPTTHSSAASIKSIDPVKLERANNPYDALQNTPTRPILINSPQMLADDTQPTKLGSSLIPPLGLVPHLVEDRDVKSSNQLKADDALKLYTSKLRARELPEMRPSSSPNTSLGPWLVVLNPSNPDVSGIDNSVLFSRWQHVFPRPSEMRVLKWKSLCSPAAVPLTSEYFPPKSEFDSDYQRQPYTIAQNIEDEFSEESKTREDLLRELISARLSHGFQVVIGPSLVRGLGQKSIKTAEIFSSNHTIEDGTSIYMSVGNTIHQLSCVNSTEVEVNIFVRRPAEPRHIADHPWLTYKPAIRNILRQDYLTREIDIFAVAPQRNWNYIDSYLAGHTDEVTENLRYWRARFVLIPMSSRNSSISKPGNEDSEEEIRIEGISKLAQQWQKHRFLPPSERNFQSAGKKKLRDPNPLDIVYNTEDPSVVIAAEMETLPLFENPDTTHRKGFISRKDRFLKSNFNIAALAEAIQQPVENGGIKMQTRRWHLRLHYDCFIGSEMTTWLLDNFEDLENREEAVELGNSLMLLEDDKFKDREKEGPRDPKKDRERGIFVHVEKRHHFRDGQYFYQIAGEYAKSTPSGWFNSRRKDVSVPSTPSSEQVFKDSPRLAQGPQRPMPIVGETSPISGATTPTMPSSSNAKRAKVVLSKVMKYDVDHRKRSNRPERINLHYDRLHNPDNCFHIRIEWMSVTAKLIEDALKGWATLASQHGLRLVEVPIAEACQVAEYNPFRKPYGIKLAVPPPTQRPMTYYNPNYLGPQSQPGKFFYQKALLRKLDYVLDIEAASSFPSNVDVTWSWGKLDYKYTQYIHRSGTLMVEITDEGDFTCAVNRLFSNRVPTAPNRNEQNPLTSERLPRLVSAGAYTSHSLVETAPISSPMFRPVLFAQQRTRDSHPPPAEIHSPMLGSGQAPFFASRNPTGAWDPTVLIEKLEDLCSDIEALEAFYKETLENGNVMGTPNTVPSAAEQDAVPDAHIPVLGLPPGILGSEIGGSPSPRMGLQGSLMQRRPSVQH